MRDTAAVRAGARGRRRGPGPALVLPALLLAAGCAAGFGGGGGRRLDDLSASYERLVGQAEAAEQARRAPQATPPGLALVPPTGEPGPGFLEVGRAALETAADNSARMHPATRIGLYRLAAASAHFALVEEVRDGGGGAPMPPPGATSCWTRRSGTASRPAARRSRGRPSGTAPTCKWRAAWRDWPRPPRAGGG